MAAYEISGARPAAPKPARGPPPRNRRAARRPETPAPKPPPPADARRQLVHLLLFAPQKMTKICNGRRTAGRTAVSAAR